MDEAGLMWGLFFGFANLFLAVGLFVFVFIFYDLWLNFNKFLVE